MSFCARSKQSRKKDPRDKDIGVGNKLHYFPLTPAIALDISDFVMQGEMIIHLKITLTMRGSSRRAKRAF
jgi:hypothetical protein